MFFIVLIFIKVKILVKKVEPVFLEFPFSCLFKNFSFNMTNIVSFAFFTKFFSRNSRKSTLTMLFEFLGCSSSTASSQKSGW
jgi:hypothetical protein